MSMSDNVPGSKWWKFDFHTHTPASNDYGRGNNALKEITPDEWLQKAMEAELDCVAVTDHNSGNWVDKLKDTYVRLCEQEEKPEWFRPIVIFPGVEITVADSRGRVHLLAIFDPSCDTQKISGILGACGITDNHGDDVSTSTEKSFFDVVKCIRQNGGIPIPAHIDASKGLLDGVTSLTPELKSSLMEVLVAEFCNVSLPANIPYELKIQIEALGKIAGSDAHTPNDIAKHFSWIKMSSPSKEELWLAFFDSEYCIKNQSANPNCTPDLFLTELNIKKMKHCGRTPNKYFSLRLHPNFNTFIGGRGAGKSSMLESIRIAAGRATSLVMEAPKLKDELDKFMKLEDGVMLEDTEIQLMLHKLGKYYRISWQQQQGTAIFKLAEKNHSTWDDCEIGNIDERFPLSIFSQKQIHELASSPQGLMKIIDDSPEVDRVEWNGRWENLKNNYLKLCVTHRELFRRIQERKNFETKIIDIENALKHYEEKGHGEILFNFQNRCSQENAIIKSDEFKSISDVIDGIMHKIELRDFQSNFFDNECADKIELNEIHTAAYSSIVEAKNNIISALNCIKKAEEVYVESINNSAWKKSYKKSLEDYEELKSQYEESSNTLSFNMYSEWVKDRNELQKKINELNLVEKDLSNVIEKKNLLYDSLIMLRKELYEKRKKFLEQVIGKNSFVRMDIVHLGDVTNLESNYRSLFGIEQNIFSSSIFEEDSHESILYKLLTWREKGLAHDALPCLVKQLKEDTYDIATGKKSAVHGAFGNRLSASYEKSRSMFDELQIWWPDDLLQVKYAQNSSSTKFEMLEKGSAGQKAAAILAFLLSYGTWPIIIDQPEDDLDNALIYDLIVKKIQETKNIRQIVMVTHNPNIVVNGDAELINVMAFQNGQIQVKCYGGLGKKEIRKEICTIMEGGETALDKRYKRLFLAKDD